MWWSIAELALMLAATVWIFIEVGRVSRAWKGDENQLRAAVYRFRRQGFVAMGCFQLAVAGVIVLLNIQEGGDTWSSAVTLGMVGLGFIVAGTWHPLERIFGEQ